jgi:uncharacterized protein (DUF1501 family)
MSHHDDFTSRRAFLQQVGAWSALMAAGNAAAQSATDYKALVCIYLAGGNDAYNTVLATDPASWASYNNARAQVGSSIALMAPGTAPDTSKELGTAQRLGGVLPITPATSQSSRAFALHPSLGKLRGLFANKRLAIVANVGMLKAPLSRDDFLNRQGDIPPKLFSHNDQQSAWQSGSAEILRTGWGGRLTDSFFTTNSPGLYNAVSIAGNALWLNGAQVSQYHLSASGPVKMAASDWYPSSVNEALKRIASNGQYGAGAGGTPRSSHMMALELGNVAKRSMTAESIVSMALSAFPADSIGGSSALNYTNVWGRSELNPLASQLQMVARMVASAQDWLNAKRQIFFVQLPGFDTHDGQIARHADLMLRLNHALAYFDSALNTLGLANKVTTFTSSEFGRTFTNNGDGTDHGWGSHHFVMGGAVKGGDIYGTFPTYGTKSAADNSFTGSTQQVQNGILLPTYSVDQYGATLGRWFGRGVGVDEARLKVVFPNLGNFTRADLGFMA